MEFVIDMKAIKDIVKTDQETKIVPDKLRFEAHKACFNEILKAMGKSEITTSYDSTGKKTLDIQIGELRKDVMEELRYIQPSKEVPESVKVKVYSTKGNKSEDVDIMALLTQAGNAAEKLMHLYHSNTRGVNQPQIVEQEQVVRLLAQNFIVQGANAEVNSTIKGKEGTTSKTVETAETTTTGQSNEPTSEKDKDKGSNGLLSVSNTAITNAHNTEQYNALIDAFIDSIQPKYNIEGDKGKLTKHYKAMLQGLKISGISADGTITYAESGSALAEFQTDLVQKIGKGYKVDFHQVQQKLTGNNDLFEQLYGEYLQVVSDDKKIEFANDIMEVSEGLPEEFKPKVSDSMYSAITSVKRKYTRKPKAYTQVDSDKLKTNDNVNDDFVTPEYIGTVYSSPDYEQFRLLFQTPNVNNEILGKTVKDVMKSTMYHQLSSIPFEIIAANYRELGELELLRKRDKQAYIDAKKMIAYYKQICAKGGELTSEQQQTLDQCNGVMQQYENAQRQLDIRYDELRSMQHRLLAEKIKGISFTYDEEKDAQQIGADHLVKDMNALFGSIATSILAVKDENGKDIVDEQLKARVIDDLARVFIGQYDWEAHKKQTDALISEIFKKDKDVKKLLEKTFASSSESLRISSDEITTISPAKLRLIQESMIMNELVKKPDEVMLDFLNGLACRYQTSNDLSDFEMAAIKAVFEVDGGSFQAKSDKTTHALLFKRNGTLDHKTILKAYSIARVEQQLRILKDPKKSKQEKEEVKKEMYGPNPEEEKGKQKKQEKSDFKSFWPNKKYKYEYYCALEKMLNSYVLSYSTQQYLKQQTEQALKEHQDELAKQAAHEDAKDLMFIVMQGAIKEKMQQQGLLNEDGSLTADAETKNKYLVEQYKLITKASGLNKDDCTSDSGIKDDNSKQLTEKGKAKKLIVDATMGIETEMSSDADVAEWIAANELAGLFAESEMTAKELEDISLALQENNICITAEEKVDGEGQLRYRSLDEIGKQINDLKEQGVDVTQLEALEALRKRLLAMMMRMQQATSTINNYDNSSVLASGMTDSDYVKTTPAAAQAANNQPAADQDEELTIV